MANDRLQMVESNSGVSLTISYVQDVKQDLLESQINASFRCVYVCMRSHEVSHISFNRG